MHALSESGGVPDFAIKLHKYHVPESRNLFNDEVCEHQPCNSLEQEKRNPNDPELFIGPAITQFIPEIFNCLHEYDIESMYV
jgi:hypothetical protein